MPYSLWISVFWACKIDFKYATAVWLKQNPQRIITRDHMARFFGFAWCKAAAMGVDISAFESTGIFSFEPHQSA
jgi:hypothetical protein